MPNIEPISFPSTQDTPWRMQARQLIATDYLPLSPPDPFSPWVDNVLPVAENVTYCGLAEGEVLLALGVITMPCRDVEAFATRNLIVVANGHRGQGLGREIIFLTENVAYLQGAPGIKVNALNHVVGLLTKYGYEQNPHNPQQMQRRLPRS